MFSSGSPVVQSAEPAADAAAVTYTAAQVDYFEKHVRPLLVKRCTECHGDDPDDVAGGLSLINRVGWMEGGDSGPAVVPGKPEDSLLLKAIRYEGHLEMPPDERLPASDVAVVETWIKMGAPDPRDGKKLVAKGTIDLDAGRTFWAFQKPKRVDVPAVRDADWATSDIDRFIQAKLEAANLRPNDDVDPAVLLRRIYFVLVGLPPTPEEVAAFQADPSPAALAQVVDRLLASPHYGETWGRHWLDVARYADSNGNDFNATFHDAYRYRNYVIRAFQEDKPFPQFIREQLAGDLMSAESEAEREEQIVATSFLAMGTKMLSERDKEKLSFDVVDEQVDTVGRAFLGLTLGCARCHDHKFDPIPTADYYAMAGIFRSTETIQGEIQQYVSNLVRVDLPIDPEHAAALAAHQAVVDGVKKELAAKKKELASAKKPAAKKGGAKDDPKAAETARPADIRKPSDLQGVVVDNTEAKLIGDWKPSTHTPRYVGEGYVHDQKTGKGEKSIVFTPDLPNETEYEVRLSYSHSEGRESKVPVIVRHANGETKVIVNQEERPDVDGLFHTIGRFTFEAGVGGTVTISNEGTTEYVIADAVQFIPVAMLDKPEVVEAQQEMAAKIAALETELKSLEAKLKALDAEAPPPAPRALGVRDAAKPADCAICIRGEHRNRGAVVPRGFLQVLSDKPQVLAHPEASGRLELADWIADEKNPLTARVMVNRLWMHIYGEGLVRSVDNFGKLGDRPSHPELLDYLARRFIDSGWSVKALVREMVLTRTFRIACTHREEAFLADPDNRLLWRAHRHRLTAEAMHDTLLAVSGKLDRTPAGPVVSHLGALVSDNSSGTTAKFDFETHARRAVYMPIVRGQLPSMLTVFDFADPDMVTGQRSATNVPAQALLLLNGTKIRAAAKSVADQLLADASLGDEARIEKAYRLILGRPPKTHERERVLDFLNDQMTTDGLAEGAGSDRRTHDAWTRFVQTLFASTEFRWVD